MCGRSDRLHLLTCTKHFVRLAFCTQKDCSYWIPPPPTAAPTPCPEIDYNITCPEHSSVPSLASDNGSGLVSGGVGILIGIVIGGVLGKYCFRGRAGYSEIPSVDEGAVP